MKFTILQMMMVIALLAFTAALLLPRLLKQDKRKLKTPHGRVRPFTRTERLMIPFMLAMESLSAWRHRNFTWHGGNRVALGNAVLSPPGQSDSKLADEVIGRYALVKVGSDADHVALCDAGDIPCGFTRDGSAPAIGDLVAFELLGLSTKATQGTASGAITAGNLVCPGNNGVLRDVTLLGSTTVYVCGLALTSCATGGTFVFVPYAPVQRVIA